MLTGMIPPQLPTLVVVLVSSFSSVVLIQIVVTTYGKPKAGILQRGELISIIWKY